MAPAVPPLESSRFRLLEDILGEKVAKSTADSGPILLLVTNYPGA